MRKGVANIMLLALVLFGFSKIATADVCFLPDGEECGNGVPYNEGCVNGNCNPTPPTPTCVGSNCDPTPPVTCPDGCFDTEEAAISARGRSKTVAGTTFVEDSYYKFNQCWCLTTECSNLEYKHTSELGGNWTCTPCSRPKSKFYNNRYKCSCNITAKNGYTVNTTSCQWIPMPCEEGSSTDCTPTADGCTTCEDTGKKSGELSCTIKHTTDPTCPEGGSLTKPTSGCYNKETQICGTQTCYIPYSPNCTGNKEQRGTGDRCICACKTGYHDDGNGGCCSACSGYTYESDLSDSNNGMSCSKCENACPDVTKKWKCICSRTAKCSAVNYPDTAAKTGAGWKSTSCTDCSGTYYKNECDTANGYSLQGSQCVKEENCNPNCPNGTTPIDILTCGTNLKKQGVTGDGCGGSCAVCMTTNECENKGMYAVQSACESAVQQLCGTNHRCEAGCYQGNISGCWKMEPNLWIYMACYNNSQGKIECVAPGLHNYNNCDYKNGVWDCNYWGSYTGNGTHYDPIVCVKLAGSFYHSVRVNLRISQYDSTSHFHNTSDLGAPIHPSEFEEVFGCSWGTRSAMEVDTSGEGCGMYDYQAIANMTPSGPELCVAKTRRENINLDF